MSKETIRKEVSSRLDKLSRRKKLTAKDRRTLKRLQRLPVETKVKKAKTKDSE